MLCESRLAAVGEWLDSDASASLGTLTWTPELFVSYTKLWTAPRAIIAAAGAASTWRSPSIVHDANGVPDRTFNVGLDWDMPWAPGLSLNGRVINTSSTYYDAANLLRMPSWTRVDLGARYATRIAGKPVVFRANLENVADKAYWVTSTYVTVGAPRTLMLSAQIDF